MVLEKVTTFISEQFNVEEDSISEETTFDELGADEFDLSELIMAVEGEFEIEISEGDVNSISNVSDLLDIVERTINFI